MSHGLLFNQFRVSKNNKFFIFCRRQDLQAATSSPPKSPLFCVTCLMIEMGDMACYTTLCPQCDRVPPGRKILSPEVQAMERRRKYSIRLGRKYSVDIVKKNGGFGKLSSRGRENVPQNKNLNIQPEVHRPETSHYKSKFDKI